MPSMFDTGSQRVLLCRSHQLILGGLRARRRDVVACSALEASASAMKSHPICRGGTAENLRRVRCIESFPQRQPKDFLVAPAECRKGTSDRLRQLEEFRASIERSSRRLLPPCLEQARPPGMFPGPVGDFQRGDPVKPRQRSIRHVIESPPSDEEGLGSDLLRIVGSNPSAGGTSGRPGSERGTAARISRWRRLPHLPSSPASLTINYLCVARGRTVTGHNAEASPCLPHWRAQSCP